MNGKTKFVPIRNLLWTIRHLLETINGCSCIVQSETDNLPIIFNKKWTFHQLYKFPKDHKEFVFNKDIPQTSCLSEKCENLTFLAKYISPKLNLSIQTNIHPLSEAYYCDSSSKSWMYSLVMNAVITV